MEGHTTRQGGACSITPPLPLCSLCSHHLLPKWVSSSVANTRMCAWHAWSALRSQCLPSPGTPVLLPSADPSQGVLAIDEALAAGRISREASVALGLNEIHFQKSPGSPCRRGSPEDFERKRKCTSLALQEQSSAGKEKGELSPGHTCVRAAFCSICGTDI